MLTQVIKNAYFSFGIGISIGIDVWTLAEYVLDAYK